MALSILEKRRMRKVDEITKIVEKTLSPAIIQAQIQGSSGATYPVSPNRVVGVPTKDSPFAQTGGLQVGEIPLPRPQGTFDSLFGPAYPLIPDPLDTLGINGRTPPRRNEYPVTWNVQLVDRLVPWTVLRQTAENVDVVNRAVQLVQDGITGRKWSWGFSDHIINQIMVESGVTNHARAMSIAKDKYGDELHRVKEFFLRPDPQMGYTFNMWLSEIVWCSVVFDGVAIYPERNLGGETIGLTNIDPTTIKILLDNRGKIPMTPAPAYQQILYGFPRGEYQESPDIDDNDQYTYDQLAYYIRRPRPETVYGYSNVEQVLPLAALYLDRQRWMRAEYTHGSMPQMMMKFADTESWSPEQQAYYEQIWNDRLSGQIQRRQHAFFLRPGMEPTFAPQVDEKYKADYDNWIIAQIGSRFGVPATQLGVQAKSSIGGGKQIEGESAQTVQFVFNALIDFFEDMLSDLAHKFLGIGPEIVATSHDAGDDKEDLLNETNAEKTVIGFGGMTLNDYRSKNGHPLYDMPEADEPMIITGTGPVFLKGTLAAQDAKTDLLLNPPAAPAAPNKEAVENAPATNESSTSANPGSSGTPAATTRDQSNRTDASGNTVISTSEATKKELSAFVRFAKSRNSSNWRDFKFDSIDDELAIRLNELGRIGQIDMIKNAIEEASASDLSELPHAAGIVVKADDTGRVLMVQRSIKNHNETAAGLWEIPGGRLDGNESSFEAAQREWEEEIGIELPKGKIAGSWSTPDNRYEAFVWIIKHESDIVLNDARGLDGSGDKEVENVAWWFPKDLVGNPAVRIEVQSADWSLLGHAKGLCESMHAMVKSGGNAQALIDWYNDGADGAISWGSAGDFDACVAIAGKYIDNPEGFCNLRHQDATGAPPGHAPGEKSLGKANAQSHWATRPQHAYHDKIVAFYQPKLIKAMSSSIDPASIHEIVTSAQRKLVAAKLDHRKAAPIGDPVSSTLIEQIALDATKNQLKLSQTEFEAILKAIYGDSYVAGQHVAVTQIGSSATVSADLTEADAAINWSDWTPGWAEAADLSKINGLSPLFDSLTKTIDGINETTTSRLVNMLSNGLSAGSSAETIANDMTSVISSPSRALMIASTETSNALTQGNLDCYANNNVEKWEWIAEEDDRTCDICEPLDREQFSVGNSDSETPPLHPSCRCVTSPVVEISGQHYLGHGEYEASDES